MKNFPVWMLIGWLLVAYCAGGLTESIFHLSDIYAPAPEPLVAGSEPEQGFASELQHYTNDFEPLDYRAMEIRALELSIMKRIRKLNSGEYEERSDAGMMIELTLTCLRWDLERLAEYTNRDIDEVAAKYGVRLPQGDEQ